VSPQKQFKPKVPSLQIGVHFPEESGNKEQK
jgi:hypothetical protein